MTEIISKRRRFIGGFEGTPGVAQNNNFDRCVYTLDGSTEYFANDTLTNIEVGNSFTVSCWVSNITVLNDVVIWAFNGSNSIANRSGFDLRQNSTYGLWVFSTYDADGNRTYVTAGPCYAEATWNHVVCVKDDNNDMLIYHDGLYSSGALSAAMQTTYDIPRIACFGAEPVVKNNLFNGRLHSIAIWNVALSSSEVNAIFMRGQGCTVDLKQNLDMGYGVTYRSAPNLKHWWRLGWDQNDIGADYGYANNLIDMDVDSAGIDASNISQWSPNMSGMDCDGVTECLSNLTSQQYGVGNSFTVAVWGAVDAWDVVADMLFHCRTSWDNENSIVLWTYVKYINFTITDANSVITQVSSPDDNLLTDGTSIFLVGVKDANNAIHLYVNGKLIASNTTNIPTTTDALRRCVIYGSDTFDPAYEIDGRPYAAAMWDKALSAEEIKEIYNSGVETVNLSKRFGNYVSHGNLKHWWWCGSSWGKSKGNTTGYAFGLDMIPRESERINMSTDAANLTHALDERNIAVGTPYGTCIKLDGTTEYLANTSLNPIGVANAWSLSIWCYHNQPTFLSGSLFEFKPSSGTEDLLTLSQYGTLANDPFVIFLENAKIYTYNRIMFDAIWYNFIITWDGTNLKLHKNGVEISPSAMWADGPVTTTDSNRKVYVGHSANQSNYWAGRIAHIAVWNKVLNLSEITQIYSGNLTMDLSKDHNAYSSSDNLQHWWQPGGDLDDLGKDYGKASTLINIGTNSANITYEHNIIGDSPRYVS